jgi:UDPglucose 6-dehydrogenase
MKIAVVGAGYVGLVSAACFADFGHEVVCVDRDPRKLTQLEQGRIPIYELGLEPIVTANRQAGRLRFTGDLTQAVAAAEVVLLAVGTPTRADGDAADLTQLFSAASEVARALRGFTVVVTKSTVPPGTAAKLRTVMAEARPGGDFEVASNPEFMREGSAVEDFTQPDRIVVGVASPRAETVLRQLYRPLTARNIPLLVTSCEAAEVIKYAANTFLATRIAFVNQLADFCERAGADVGDVTRGMGLDKRIGPSFLAPGPGFGGSCFPKDTRAMVHAAREIGQPFTIVETVVAANEARKQHLVQRVAAAVGGTLDGRKITVLGIAFKADTDDIRDSSALTLIPGLQAGGARLAVFDPIAMDNGRQVFRDVEWCEDAYLAATGADAVVILTEWNLFRGLDLARLARVMRQPVLIDFRNLFLPDDALNAGLTYHSVGRPTVHAPGRTAAAVLPFRSGKL